MKATLAIVFSNILIASLSEASSPYIHLQTTNGRSAFDKSLYENALDPELCQRQLETTRRNTLLLMQFLESGIRIPRSITTGNLADFGNYPQCIGINEDIDDIAIQGKYCTIGVPLNQSISIPEFPPISDWFPDGIQLPDWITNPSILRYAFSSRNELLLSRIRNTRPHNLYRANNLARSEQLPLDDFEIQLAVCVPKACTVKEGLDGLLLNITSLGFQYNELSCRLANDKPWVPADYVAIVLFSLLGLLTVLSTSYDVYKTVLLKSDPKTVSTLLRSFSVYTNTRRLTTFTTSPGTLECLDGIRAIAMVWVIVGHVFFTFPAIMNQLDALDWQLSFWSFWIVTAPITVDTFFMLSGLLVVYTTAKKMTGSKLLKNLHLFYLNRILRMFPLLGAAVLVQASIMHRISDGPQWDSVAVNVENCRTNWWITLLYLQNFIDPSRMCIGLTWYLAIDMQLHIICPIVLFFVVGRKSNAAWSTLIISCLVVLVSSTIYIFSIGVKGAVITANAEETQTTYFYDYYINTLARASPFFVGMIFGYILHLYREEKMVISKFTAALLWVCALCLTSLCVFATEPMKSADWDNQTVDSLVNSFQRPGWALGLGWIIVACVQGYGGPVNWFLSLQLWKLPARISYAMFLFHMMTQQVIWGSRLSPIYFTTMFALYNFFAQFAIAFIVGFFATLLIDSPFSTLFKLLLGGGPKRPPPEKKQIEYNGNVEVHKF